MNPPGHPALPVLHGFSAAVRPGIRTIFPVFRAVHALPFCLETYEATEYGAAEFLTKPVDFEHLKAQLGQLPSALNCGDSPLDRMTAYPPAPRGRGKARLWGQFERFTPSRLSDRNGFVKETLAGTGATDGNAPNAAIQGDRAAGSGFDRSRRFTASDEASGLGC